MTINFRNHIKPIYIKNVITMEEEDVHKYLDRVFNNPTTNKRDWNLEEIDEWDNNKEEKVYYLILNYSKKQTPHQLPVRYQTAILIKNFSIGRDVDEMMEWDF